MNDDEILINPVLGGSTRAACNRRVANPRRFTMLSFKGWSSTNSMNTRACGICFPARDRSTGCRHLCLPAGDQLGGCRELCEGGIECNGIHACSRHSERSVASSLSDASSAEADAIEDAWQ